jgi:beta-galactosidase
MAGTVHRYPPINPRCPHLLHGGDYNPEQWLDSPAILDEDFRLMKLANINCVTVGVFSWATLEPQEGEFSFGWLDDVMDRLAKAGMFAVLATPSGARPAWMSQKYPEVLRVRSDRQRNLHGGRHNHCFTSPVYREKCRIISTKLADRYKDHPALLVWHVSNELAGECHCELCQQAFRAWLKRRYGDSLEAINKAWWTAFWSRIFTAWEQIASPSGRGENALTGLNLDWRRFVVDQTVDFLQAEIAPLKQITPHVPVTTNMMGAHPHMNYWKFAPALDVIANDSYPPWHGSDEVAVAAQTAFVHDLMRSLKGGRPFMLIESTPSAVNWQEVCKLKRPGMHQLASLQAVAHGADTVQYFQWRKGRGASEQFHGAIVDHAGHERTRVFADVAEVGKVLEKLDDLVGTTTPVEAAILMDWENRWALEGSECVRKQKGYMETCFEHHRALWSMGLATDVLDEDGDFSKYRLLAAPMLFMIRPGVAERIERFVSQGGAFVATYMTGQVDQSALCLLGGFPGPLRMRKLLGIWVEETDGLYEHDANTLVPAKGNPLGLTRSYRLGEICDLVHAETADVVATYGSDFYAGRPALTVNRLGQGQAWYIAARSEAAFLTDFYGKLTELLKLRKVLDAPPPQGVSACVRTDGLREFLFLLNFNAAESVVSLGGRRYRDVLTGQEVKSRAKLGVYGSMVLERLA